jgi:hypothetical protein
MFLCLDVSLSFLLPTLYKHEMDMYAYYTGSLNCIEFAFYVISFSSSLQSVPVLNIQLSIFCLITEFHWVSDQSNMSGLQIYAALQLAA